MPITNRYCGLPLSNSNGQRLLEVSHRNAAPIEKKKMKKFGPCCWLYNMILMKN